eukprot:TRINITY_DN38537_c0_g1_i1.p1 TRINITY_DN38537_c0_g1~~TRINITY_DN38537_c0_g1_i1.p1  ORF type:complete len:177 (+),score=30.29 TRINITY_DN38537_c0_g1_i1:69-599(+)
MIRQPPRSTLSSSSAASDVYKRQVFGVLMLLFDSGVDRGQFGEVKSSMQTLGHRLARSLPGHAIAPRLLQLLSVGEEVATDAVEIVGSELEKLLQPLELKRGMLPMQPKPPQHMQTVKVLESKSAGARRDMGLSPVRILLFMVAPWALYCFVRWHIREERAAQRDDQMRRIAIDRL